MVALNSMVDRTRRLRLHILPPVLLLAAWGLSLYGTLLGLHSLLAAVLAGLLGSAGCILWGTTECCMFRSRGLKVCMALFTALSAIASLLCIIPAYTVFPWVMATGWCYLGFLAVYGIAPVLVVLQVLPNRNLYSDVLTHSSYPLELTDKMGELYLESMAAKTLSPSQREHLLHAGETECLSLGPDWIATAIPISRGFVLPQTDLRDRNILQAALDKTESEIARCKALLDREPAMQEELTKTGADCEALRIPIGILKKQSDRATELLQQAKNEALSPTQRKRLQQTGTFLLTHAGCYGKLMRQAKGETISAEEYTAALKDTIATLSGLGINGTIRNIAQKSYPAMPVLSMFLAEAELLETAIDNHWSDLSISIRDDGDQLRTLVSMTGADSSQVSTWVWERNSALLTKGVRAGAGLEAGRCSVYFHIAGGDVNGTT